MNRRGNSFIQLILDIAESKSITASSYQKRAEILLSHRQIRTMTEVEGMKDRFVVECVKDVGLLANDLLAELPSCILKSKCKNGCERRHRLTVCQVSALDISSANFKDDFSALLTVNCSMCLTKTSTEIESIGK